MSCPVVPWWLEWQKENLNIVLKVAGSADRHCQLFFRVRQLAADREKAVINQIVGDLLLTCPPWGQL